MIGLLPEDREGRITCWLILPNLDPDVVVVIFVVFVIVIDELGDPCELLLPPLPTSEKNATFLPFLVK
jgi:hypothetical protein